MTRFDMGPASAMHAHGERSAGLAHNEGSAPGNANSFHAYPEYGCYVNVSSLMNQNCEQCYNGEADCNQNDDGEQNHADSLP